MVPYKCVQNLGHILNPEIYQNNLTGKKIVKRRGLWHLMTLSTIFQLYRGSSKK
jgi:hypothetical protein